MYVQYLIIVPLIFLCCGKTLLHRMISRSYLKNVTDAALYNAIVFCGVSFIYLIMNGTSLPKMGIIFYGTLYGLALALYQIFSTMALQRGPISHTVLIISFNNVFSIVFGILYCDETLNFHNVIGLVCLFLSLLLTIDFNQIKTHKFDLIWFLLSLASMISNGLSNIVLKIQKMQIPNQDISMVLVTNVAGCILLFLFYLFQTKVRKQHKTVVLHMSRVMVMLCVSLILGAYFIFYLIGVGTIPSVIFFPINSIAPTTVVALLGIFVFKDKLTRQQIVSLIFGIASTVLLCL